jgi:PAS domain S-box-containing protein
VAIASLPAVVFGSIALYVGTVHLLNFRRGDTPRYHFTFALTCFVVAAYDVFSAALYSATNVEEGVRWQNLQVVTLLVGIAPLAWFVYDFGGRIRRIGPWLLSSAAAALALLWTFAPYRWRWSDVPDVRTIVLPLGLEVTYNEVEPGPLFGVTSALGVLAFGYVLSVGRSLLRTDRRVEGRRLLIATCIFFAGVLNDVAISLQLYSSVFLVEVSFLALVVMMSYALAERSAAADRIAQSLRASRQAYREILDAVQDAIFIHDVPSGRIVDVNAAAGRLWRMPLDEIRNQGVEQLSAFPPDTTREFVRRIIKQAFELGGRLFEWHARRKDGSTFWVEISLRAAEIGGKRCVIAVVRDVTDRRGADEALRASRRELAEANNMLQLVLDTIPVRVFWKARDLTYLGCNRLFAQDAGLNSPDEIVGRDDLSLAWRREAPLYRRDDREVMETEQPRINYEEPQTTADGNRVWLRTSKLPLRDAEGRAIGVLGVYEDITQRRLEQDALRRSEENLDITLNSIGDGVIATDADGRVVRINPIAEQLTGWSRVEARGRPLSEVFHLESETDGDTPIDPYERILHPEPADGPPGGVVLVSREGKRCVISDRGSPIRDGAGRLAGVVLVFRDITEERTLQDQLLHAQKMDAIGRLAGGVAHDFNNLLQAIEGYRSLAAVSLGDPDELRSCLDDIGRATQRAATLTRRLLAFSRRDEQQARVLDLDAAVAETIRLLGQLLGPDITVELKRANRTIPVRSDPSYIEQIMLNLALNSRDAMPEGGRLTVSLRSVPPGSTELPAPLRNQSAQYVALAVGDSGIGIPTAIQDRVFEPFFTTKEVGAGTGLGLATVYAIVERLDGMIVVDSEPGRGATFTLYLPVSDEAAAEPRVEEGVVTVAGGSETVLVAEDDRQLRELIARVLRGAGYDVLVAADGAEAIAIFRENAARVDLVIADVIMPRCGGAEVEDAVRARRPEVPVLFSSGYGDALGAAGETGGVRRAVIVKPYAPGELLRRVRELLDAAYDDRCRTQSSD